MYVSAKQAKEIQDQLTLHPSYIVVCPSPEMAAELKVMHGIPGDNIKVLACMIVGGHGDIAILSRRQYKYYYKKEQDVLKKAGAANENRHT
jgi:hypothetical protein